MKTYICHKRVEAAQIVEILGVTDGTGATYVRLDDGRDGYRLPLVMTARRALQVGDYLVRYSDGYESVSPREAFEEGYIALPNGVIGTALAAGLRAIADRVENDADYDSVKKAVGA